MNPTELVAFAKRMAEACGNDPSAFGLPAGLVDSLATSVNILEASNLNVLDAQNKVSAAYAERENNRTNVVEAVSVVAKLVYAQANIRPVNVSATGLKKHEKRPLKLTVNSPIRPLAIPSVHGNCTLHWHPNQNKERTIYLVQMCIPGGKWETVEATTRLKAVIPNCPPGEPRLFAIIAQRGDQKSLPSPTVAIYADQKLAKKLALAA